MDLEALRQERKEMSAELFDQEYMCSWDYGMEGSYFARQMNRAITEGRICAVPYDESLPVWVACDLGLRDSTALWFAQVEAGGRLKLIDYHESSGEQLKYYADLLRSKPYTYGSEIILPHDGGAERLGMESIQNQLEDMGFPCAVLPVERSVLPGIDGARVGINKAVFDEEKTRAGRAALSAYRREYDDRRNVFKQTPLHDWSSDGADAFRYLCRAHKAGMLHSFGWSSELDYSELHRASI
jgi:hypothetical protein